MLGTTMDGWDEWDEWDEYASGTARAIGGADIGRG
jgi:hypothetical protein